MMNWSLKKDAELKAAEYWKLQYLELEESFNIDDDN
jgi:hypothetical protein